MRGTNVMLRGVLVLLAMALVGTPLFAQEYKGQPVKVFVFAAEAKFVDADSKGRADSLLDVQKQLKKKDKEVVLVPSVDEAEITLEVLGRGYLDTGATERVKDYSFGGGYKTVPVTVRTVDAKMTMGDYSKAMSGVCPSSVLVRQWTVAAGDLANDVVKWIKDNDARIPRK